MTRSKDMPLFGPLFPKGARFPRTPAFRDFLLAKAVNAENAAEKSEKFRSMATRTRQEYLKDLAENYVTTTPIDSSTKFPLLSLGGKRKDKMKGTKGAELHSAGALVWAVMVCNRDDGETGEHKLPCLLGVSAESVVLIERCTRRVVFNCSCRDVIGWKVVTETKEGGPCLDIFYERGESVSISVMESQAEDIREVVQRLEVGDCGMIGNLALSSLRLSESFIPFCTCAAGYTWLRGAGGHPPARWSRATRFLDERGRLRDGAAAILLRRERRPAAVGSCGAAMRTLAGSPEPRGEDQAAAHCTQDPHHCHPTGRERKASQVGDAADRRKEGGRTLTRARLGQETQGETREGARGCKASCGSEEWSQREGEREVDSS